MPLSHASVVRFQPQAFALFIKHLNLFSPQDVCTSRSFCLDLLPPVLCIVGSFVVIHALV